MDADKEPTPVGVEFVGRNTVPLGSASFRWLDVKRFSLEPSVPDHAAVRALMQHDRYRDHYANDEAHWERTDDLHGPFRLSLLSPAQFVEMTPSAARQLLGDWAEEWDGATADGFSDVLAAVSAALADHATVFHLVADREEMGHDWGFVLGDFHELVVIDRVDHELLLVVASDD